MTWLRAAIVVILAVTLGGAADPPQGWQVTSVEGVAKHGAAGAQVSNPTVGLSLVDGSWIETGAGGKVVVTRGKGSASIGAATRVAFFPDGKAEAQILQTLGLVSYALESVPLRVDTAFSSASAKTANFSVQIMENSTVIAVTSGEVTVTSTDKKDEAIIKPGSTATFDQTGHFKVTKTKKP